MSPTLLVCETGVHLHGDHSGHFALVCCMWLRSFARLRSRTGGQAVHMEDEPLTSSRDGPSTPPTISGANVSSPTVTPQGRGFPRDCFPSWWHLLLTTLCWARVGNKGTHSCPYCSVFGQHAALVVVAERLEVGERLFAFLDDLYASPERSVVHDLLQEEVWRHTKISLHQGPNSL